MTQEEKVQDLYDKISALRDEVKLYAQEADDTKYAVLCETSAEVLKGLETAFSHYLNKSEAARQEWRLSL